MSRVCSSQLTVAAWLQGPHSATTSMQYAVEVNAESRPLSIFLLNPLNHFPRFPV